jgi:hypothetical protein
MNFGVEIAFHGTGIPFLIFPWRRRIAFGCRPKKFWMGYMRFVIETAWEGRSCSDLKVLIFP